MRDQSRNWNSASSLILIALFALFFSMPLMAQQTGEIAGKVTDAADGSAIADVAIQATGTTLPGMRTTNTSASGDYRLPLLPPGEYTLTFTLPDDSTRTRVTTVLLEQRTTLNLSVDFSINEAAMEEVIVVSSSPLAEIGDASINAAISNEVFEALPVGNEYRDLIKLIPGVQLTQDDIRGPSAGGSGQDNVYQFDGVDVTLPMYGTLSSEPSTHDIDQVSIIRGGAKAIGFNRSGGFTVNTISKSGTNEFHGEVSYKTQPASLEEESKNETRDFEVDQDWIAANFSGPIIKDKLFFYASYYRPTVTNKNKATAYGEVPDYKSVRDEYFGKLTWAPTDNLLFDGSFRTSERTEKNASVGAYDSPTTSSGATAEQDIGIIEGSWVINSNSSAYFKVTDYSLKTQTRPDNPLDLNIAIGDSLDVNNLDLMGQFYVPEPQEGEDEWNAFIQPIIDKYGYVENGVPTGGGSVGGYWRFEDIDFYRDSFEIGYDITLDGGSATHDLHFGYKWEEIAEHYSRTSNGWGDVYVADPGAEFDGNPYAYYTSFYQVSLEGLNVPEVLHSRSEMSSIEINDTIRWQNWTFNIGVMLSNDYLYGEGLKPNKDNASGFELAPGNKYVMKHVDWTDQISPRLGVNWDFSDNASAFANYARYYPAASSLPRAASWDRNNHRTRNAYFDEDGNFLANQGVRSSSGKLWAKGIDPRHVDEYIVGVNWDATENLTTRGFFRYRASRGGWEDTENMARVCFDPPENIPREPYIPNLEEKLAELGVNPSTGCGVYWDYDFVIAELQGAYSDYVEANLEAEYQADNWYLRGSYVWSDYTGNFDQDNTSTVNDANRFIGSSLIGDGYGRQLWNYKDGTLRGDRTHQLKIYGYYEFGWNGVVGAYGVYQSGQPWETWDRTPYDPGGLGSFSDTSKFVEKAGSRRTDSHYQLDLNYTQNFYFGSNRQYGFQLRADIFNVFDKQTGYNIDPRRRFSTYAEPRSFWKPRTVQLAAVFVF